ncbi:MAG: hypothetical protein BWY93_00749 [Euryarchaeota archaeon ADurb.BinA087]|nr:MAG: hypothetical protein BWY93_00749 [Euryarchaeota archaeon ADurb.BinA087]
MMPSKYLLLWFFSEYSGKTMVVMMRDESEDCTGAGI